MKSEESIISENFVDIEKEFREKNGLSEKERTNGIIAYITIVGLIIAIIYNQKQKSDYVKFHIKRMMGIIALTLSPIIIMWIPFIGLLSWVVWAIALVFWVMSILSAINGQREFTLMSNEIFYNWFRKNS